jgi:hypothetical protein
MSKFDKELMQSLTQAHSAPLKVVDVPDVKGISAIKFGDDNAGLCNMQSPWTSGRWS